MKLKHVYIGGRKGITCSYYFEGTVAECVEHVLNYDCESGNFNPDSPNTDDHSINGWTREEVEEELLEAMDSEDPFVVDRGRAEIGLIIVMK